MRLPELGIAAGLSAMSAYLLAHIVGLAPMDGIGVSLGITSAVCYWGSLKDGK